MIANSKTPSKNVCECRLNDKTTLDRVKRPAWVKFFLFWLPIKVYKCFKCGRRHWVIK